MSETVTPIEGSLQFGFQLTPTPAPDDHGELVRVAEAEGLDLVGVQDHPYVPELVDTLSLIGTLLGATERLRFFPDVANLPLRPPAMLAKAAASLDVLSGGRFELALGSGGYGPAIASMGGPERSPADAVEALEEAVTLLRRMWSDSGEPVHYHGRHYTLAGVEPGPAPAHAIGIWLGSQGPRMLRLAGRVADGWAAPIAPYLPYERWPRANELIDEGARAAGRDPGQVRRLAQLVGTISDEAGPATAREGTDPVRGTPEQWVELLTRLASDQPFRTFVFWPEQTSVEQIRRFAREVVPRVRAQLTRTSETG